jgi:hypothetical protein
MAMRRVIRRRIRHTEEGLNVAIDFNADVAINTGQDRPAPAAHDEEAKDDPDPSKASEEEGKQP